MLHIRMVHVDVVWLTDPEASYKQSLLDVQMLWQTFVQCVD